ncbi:MAG: hypothetical protein AAB449_01860 [Patescibacteria group bacterium]
MKGVREKPELYFELQKEVADFPRHRKIDDADIMQELIKAIPLVWGAQAWASWLDGELRAPSRLLRDQGAVPDLWLEIGDFNAGYPFAVSISDRAKDLTPNIAALLIRKRNPGFVRFDKAGYLPRNRAVTFETAREIAGYYVLRGYRGHLYFGAAARAGDLTKSPVSCDMQLDVWEGYYPEAGTQEPRIRLQWDEGLGGRREHIEPLAAICRTHGLNEYEIIGAADHYRKFEVQFELPFE